MFCSLWIPDNEIKVHNPSNPMFNNQGPNNNSSCYSVTMVCCHNTNWSCQKHVPVAMVLAFSHPSPGSNRLITISLAQCFMPHYFTTACRTSDLQNTTYLPNVPLFTDDFVTKHCLLSKRPDCAPDRILRDVHQLPEWLYKQQRISFKCVI